MPSFIKIGSAVQKLIGGLHRYAGTHTQDCDRIRVLLFFQNKECMRERAKQNKHAEKSQNEVTCIIYNITKFKCNYANHYAIKKVCIYTHIHTDYYEY
jgi:hypothetical protein